MCLLNSKVATRYDEEQQNICKTQLVYKKCLYTTPHMDIIVRNESIEGLKWGPMEGTCSMAVPTMSTRNRTSALQMPSIHQERQS